MYLAVGIVTTGWKKPQFDNSRYCSPRMQVLTGTGIEPSPLSSK